MDAQLARTLRVGDTVLYRSVPHTVLAASARGAPSFTLHGPYATRAPVPASALYLPVLRNPPDEDD